MNRTQTSLFIVHCADTPNGSQKFSVRDVDQWHAARGFRRDHEDIAKHSTLYPYIGYHGVILHDGTLVHGRGPYEKGAHCEGENWRSVGYCLMGTDAFSVHQWETLKILALRSLDEFPGIKIIGHNERSKKKCPGFDVQAWLAGGMAPAPGHVLG